MNKSLELISAAKRVGRPTDGADLVVSDPNSGVRRRGCFDTEPAAEGDDGLLQLTDIPTNTLPEQNQRYESKHIADLTLLISHLFETAQVQNRVADQLSWAVEGDESSSVGAVDVGPQQPELLQQGTGVRFVPDPGSVDRWVLAQQQGVSRTGPEPV